jgi:hypothetical protein
MGLALMLLKTQSVMLALQDSPSSSLSDSEAMALGFAFITIVVIVGSVGVWMVIDAWINYGPGWAIGSGVSCLIGTLGCGVGGCIIIIPYLIIRFAALPPRLYRERMANRDLTPPPVYPAGTPPAYPEAHPPHPVPPNLELAPLERDERIDEMLAQGKAREAMEYAQQMYKMAQDFHDTEGLARYAKYIDRMRRGIK